jgi:hypothetical protein
MAKLLIDDFKIKQAFVTEFLNNNKTLVVKIM